MEKKKRKIDILINLALPIVWAFVLLFCVLLFAFTSNAASNSNSLPISPDYYNTSLTEEELIDLLSACDTQYNKDFTSGNYFTMFGDYRIFGRYNNIVELHCYVFKIPDNYISFSNSINENNYDSFIWSNISEGISCNFDCIRYALKLEGGVWTPYGFSNSTANIKDSVEPVENTYFTYKAQVVSYSTTSVYVNSTSNKKVITLGSDDVVIPTGHATAPDSFENPTLSSGSNHTLPREVPESPVINNYSWTTYNSPTIDNSTLESLIESLIDVTNYLAGWLSNNLSGEFQNLISNIQGLIEYIGETIQYYCGLIISNIQNGIETFYNNMVSLFEPIAQNLEEIREGFEEFADLFIHPFDEEEFDEQIANSSFFTNYNALIDNCEVLTEIFEYAEERDHFSLYISFENPFADSEHKIISSEINFDWLVPLRSVYRPFIWVCVLVELFIGGARVLTRILGGHGIG